MSKKKAQTDLPSEDMGKAGRPKSVIKASSRPPAAKAAGTLPWLLQNWFWLGLAGLLVAVLAAFSGAFGHEFVSWDDHIYGDVWGRSQVVHCDQCADSLDECRIIMLAGVVADRPPLPFGSLANGPAFCHSSLEGRIGGLGIRAQGCAVCLFLFGWLHFLLAVFGNGAQR